MRILIALVFAVCALPAYAVDVPKAILQEMEWAQAQKLKQLKAACARGNTDPCTRYQLELAMAQAMHEDRVRASTQPCDKP